MKTELEIFEHAIISLRDKAALIANNAPEERERFIGRQMILICELALLKRYPKEQTGGEKGWAEALADRWKLKATEGGCSRETLLYCAQELQQIHTLMGHFKPPTDGTPRR